MVDKHISMKEIQRDIDAGWKDWCDERIQLCRLQISHACDDSTVRRAKRELNHFKVLRRMP